MPAGFQKGMTWGFAARPGFFASEEARKDVDEMFATGVRWIVLTPNVWQEQYCSTRQFADFEKSIPDFELMDIIDYIHKKGMCVQFRPMLECPERSGRLVRALRGSEGRAAPVLWRNRTVRAGHGRAE